MPTLLHSLPCKLFSNCAGKERLGTKVPRHRNDDALTNKLEQAETDPILRHQAEAGNAK